MQRGTGDLINASATSASSLMVSAFSSQHMLRLDSENKKANTTVLLGFET
jgi:hypothetical protein